VGEVGLRSGFVQQNHFARLFQKKTGVTPTAFRRQLYSLTKSGRIHLPPTALATTDLK
jgi:AraC-like DNA-binding protein